MTRRNTTTRTHHRAALSRTQPPCAICGEPIDYTLRYPDPRAYVVDHIIPLNRGGTDTLHNKQPAHNACNREKSDKLVPKTVKRSGSLQKTPNPQAKGWGDPVPPTPPAPQA